MARNASPDSLRATATRSYSGDVPAASTSPKYRYTSARVRALLTGTALPAVGPGISTSLAIETTIPAAGPARGGTSDLQAIAGGEPLVPASRSMSPGDGAA